ncbi:MAG: hypothetical protein ACRETM_06875 [Stenotrophobium sp.]
MTALTDALDQLTQIHQNSMALADPAAQLFTAEMNFKRAVVAAIEGLQSGAVPAGDNAALDEAIAKANALEQQNAALTTQLETEQAAIAKFATEVQAPVVAEPVAAPTIAPTTPGV